LDRGSGAGIQVTALDVEARLRPVTVVGNSDSHADVRGVIDTGADTVLIPRSIAKRLSLRPIRNTIAILASGERRAAISYMGVLEIPAIGFRDEIEMTAMTDGGESNHILLGKNFLRQFLVTIDCANDVVHYQLAKQPYSPPIDDE
jgi:predicted aspartyl protease